MAALEQAFNLATRAAPPSCAPTYPRTIPVFASKSGLFQRVPSRFRILHRKTLEAHLDARRLGTVRPRSAIFCFESSCCATAPLQACIRWPPRTYIVCDGVSLSGSGSRAGAKFTKSFSHGVPCRSARSSHNTTTIFRGRRNRITAEVLDRQSAYWGGPRTPSQW